MNERASSFRRLPAVVALACFAITGHARAQHGEEWSSAISVRGGSSCVSAAALRNRIARYLAAGAPPPALAIEVNLAGDPPSFRVLRAGDSIAERRFERLPAGCAERRDAIALTIAVAIEHALPIEQRAADAPAASSARGGPSQPSAADGAPLPTPATAPAAGTRTSPAPAAATETAPQPTAAVTPAPAAAPADAPEPDAPEPELSSSYADNLPSAAAWVRPTQRWMLHAGAAYLLQALPSPAPVFTLGAEVAAFPALRVGLSGLASANVTTADFPPGRVESQLFGGQAFACLNTPLSFVIVHGCTGAAAALVRARGFEYDAARSAGMGWLAGVLRLVFEVPATGAIAIRLTGAGHLNLVRPRLVLESESAGGQDVTKPVKPFGAAFGAEFLVRID